MYKYDNNGEAVIEVSTGVCIALPPGGEAGSRFLAWLAEGNTPEPADPIPVPPIVVSPRQIRQALTRANLRDQVEAAVAAGDQDIKDWWEFAIQIEENHPMVVGMAQGLGVDEAALHDLFMLASTL